MRHHKRHETRVHVKAGVFIYVKHYIYKVVFGFFSFRDGASRYSNNSRIYCKDVAENLFRREI